MMVYFSICLHNCKASTSGRIFQHRDPVRWAACYLKLKFTYKAANCNLED